MFFGLVKRELPFPVRRKLIDTVLIVEDEPLVAFDNEHVLIQAGYRIVATVGDHDLAIRAIAAGGIDLVVADVTLNGARTGIDVAHHAAQQGLPVLFVTALCPLDARAIAVGCLAKPYSPRDLVSAIRVVDAICAGVPEPKAPPGLHLFAQDR